MWTLRFRPELEQDIRNARNWYDSKVPGLGDEFEGEFWEAVDRIAERPLSYAVASNGLRPCRLHRFSYPVHFHVVGEEILVVAVMNSARDDLALEGRG